MSTICCMLHLLGSRLGQLASTLKRGAPEVAGAACARAVGLATRAKKQQRARANSIVALVISLICINCASRGRGRKLNVRSRPVREMSGPRRVGEAGDVEISG